MCFIKYKGRNQTVKQIKSGSELGGGKMRLGSVQLYYNEKKGFIIAAKTKIRETGMNTKINPVTVLDESISNEKVGKQIKEDLKKSRNALPIERIECENYKFWQITGIKGFSTFSKKFDCLNISEKDDMLEIIKLERGSSGAYFYPKDKNSIILKSDVSDKELGNHIMNILLAGDDEKDNSMGEFKTLNGNTVIYRKPTDFFSVGDGHTDAYQMYLYEKDESTYFAFMIDSGYQKVDNIAIRNYWEEAYGILEEYEYEESDSDLIKIMITAKTKDAYTKSYFLKEGEDLLEIFIRIHAENELCQISVFEQEIRDIIESVKII